MPSVSSDGSILAYDGTASCTGGPLCQGSFTARGFISGAQLSSALTFYGSLRISHNGQYAIRFGGARGYPQFAALYDFQSRQFVYSLTGSTCFIGCTVPGDGRQSVADDGTVLTNQGLWRNGQIKTLGLSQGQIVSRLSPDGSVVIYDSAVISACYGSLTFGFCDFNNMLHAYNIATGVEVHLAKGPTFQGGARGLQQPYFFPSVSSDGQLVLYRAPDPQTGLPQAFLSATDGTRQRQLTNDPAGIAEAVLCGDAHRAFAITQNGGLLAIDVDSSHVRTLLSGGVPFITKTTGAIVPGSLVTFTGTDLLSADGRSRLSFGALQAPVLSSTQNSVTIQVPWELDVNLPVTVSGANPDSPFEQAAAFQPVLAAPEFLTVFHADFTPLTTYGDFAKPGEILIFYMTGLGPVSPPIATGQAARYDRQSYVQLPLHCVWDAGTGVDQTADIQFAGLAPGTIGVYQVNVPAPGTFSGTTISEHFLKCASLLPSGESSASATTNIVVATAQ